MTDISSSWLKSRADILRNWYSKKSIVYEMIRFTMEREFVFLAPKFMAVEGKGFNSRMWRIHSLQHFQEVLFNGMRFDNIEGITQHDMTEDLVFNCYVSLATYEGGVPYRSLANLKEQDKEVQKNLWKKIKAYDFLVDIDADYKHKTIGWAYESQKMVMQLFDAFMVEYYFYPSGAGFQTVVPLDMKKINSERYSYDPLADLNVYDFFTFVLSLMNTHVSEMIDVSVCKDERRVRKLPYSLTNYKNAVYVVLPIIDKDLFLSGFSYDAIRPSVVKDSLGFRGYKVFNISDVPNEEKFLKMVEYLEGKMLKKRKRGVVMDGS